MKIELEFKLQTELDPLKPGPTCTEEQLMRALQSQTPFQQWANEDWAMARWGFCLTSLKRLPEEGGT